MSNRLYDILKYFSSIALPAIAALYLTLSDIWNLPYGEKISATILAVVALMNTLLGVSSVRYRKIHTADDTEKEISNIVN